MNPAYQFILEIEYTKICEGKPNAIPLLGVHVRASLNEIAFNPNLIAKFEFPETPPWLYTPVNVDLSLAETKKEDTSPDYFLSKYREIKENHEGFEFIYTGGSHIENISAAAAVSDDHIYSERLPDHSTIVSAEMHAIFLALDYVERHQRAHIS